MQISFYKCGLNINIIKNLLTIYQAKYTRNLGIISDTSLIIHLVT